MLEDAGKSSLKTFLSNEMQLPFAMRNAHRVLYMALAVSGRDEMELDEFLQVFHRTLQADTIHSSWLTFAADCVEMYVRRGGHFVEKSEDVT